MLCPERPQCFKVNAGNKSGTAGLPVSYEARGFFVITKEVTNDLERTKGMHVAG